MTDIPTPSAKERSTMELDPRTTAVVVVHVQGEIITSDDIISALAAVAA